MASMSSDLIRSEAVVMHTVGPLKPDAPLNHI